MNFFQILTDGLNLGLWNAYGAPRIMPAVVILVYGGVTWSAWLARLRDRKLLISQRDSLFLPAMHGGDTACGVYPLTCCVPLDPRWRGHILALLPNLGGSCPYFLGPHRNGFDMIHHLRTPRSSTTASVTGMLATAMLLSGCGSSEATGTSTFVSHDKGSATTISWTDDGSGHLEGSLQTATPNESGTGDRVKSMSVSFTGTLYAERLSIVSNGSTCTGWLSGDDLVLDIPQSNDSTAPITFARGKLSDFTSAVSNLRDQVGRQRASATSGP
jgi:hypothetical protein